MRTLCHGRDIIDRKRRRKLTHENKRDNLKTLSVGGARNAKEWDNNEEIMKIKESAQAGASRFPARSYA
jgi:hypothetical protein